MRAILTILIGFLHDFAAGGWAASGLAVYWLERRALPPELDAALFGLKREFFLLGLLCLALVMATGAGRSFTYVSQVYGAENESRRRRLLMVKHLILLTIFGLGTWWQYRATFH